VRDYGLFAANPFGLHDFEKKEKGAGDLTVPAQRASPFAIASIFTKAARMRQKWPNVTPIT